jgi:hypothetical protein
MTYYTIVLLMFGLAFSSCSRRAAMISIHNGSSVTISNVTVSGAHFGLALGSVQSGMWRGFALKSSSETNVWISFSANGQKFDSRGKEQPIYFVASSKAVLTLTIDSDLKVSSKNH